LYEKIPFSQPKTGFFRENDQYSTLMSIAFSFQFSAFRNYMSLRGAQRRGNLNPFFLALPATAGYIAYCDAIYSLIFEPAGKPSAVSPDGMP
jgi:hypothetical protein